MLSIVRNIIKKKIKDSNPDSDETLEKEFSEKLKKQKEELIVELQDNEPILYDRLTPYYQSDMNRFSPNKRRIIMAIMRNYNVPIGPTEISRNAIMNTNSVGSELVRMARERILTNHYGKYSIDDENFFKWLVFRYDQNLKNI